jgi:hypothetical protein
MFRRITVTLAAAGALAFAACGSDEGSKASAVMPETAKALVERTADVKLTAVAVPEEAREQGLRASYSNASTAVKDKQVVALFVMKDARVADKVSEMVRSSAPTSARMIVNDEVMVVYAAAGSNRGAALEKAVEAL